MCIPSLLHSAVDSHSALTVNGKRRKVQSKRVVVEDEPETEFVALLNPTQSQLERIVIGPLPLRSNPERSKGGNLHDVLTKHTV